MTQAVYRAIYERGRELDFCLEERQDPTLHRKGSHGKPFVKNLSLATKTWFYSGRLVDLLHANLFQDLLMYRCGIE